jgi:hypothetical protein
MSESDPPPFDSITETPYETPTAEELAQLEELGPQWYSEAGLDAAAETTTTTAAEVGTEAAVETGLVVAEEGAMSIPVVGVAIAGGIAVGAVVGEGLWELDKAISNRPHSEAADDENNPLLSEEDKELMRRHTEGG